MAGQSRGDLDALRERAAHGETAACDALAEVVASPSADTQARIAAVEALATVGAGALRAVEALRAALEDRDPGLRRATVALLVGAGAALEDWSEAAARCLARGDGAIPPLLATWGASALPMVLAALSGSDALHVRRVAVHALVEIAGVLDGEEVEAPLTELLTCEEASLQQLALEVVARLRRPPASLAELVADLSRFPGARRALLRFDRDVVKRELSSLIKSQYLEERLCGLAIVQEYGASAAELAELVASELARDTQAETAVASVHVLHRIVPASALAAALEPALDHWSDAVRTAARSYLSALDIEPRASVWDGHPFADALIRELQRIGCRPRGSMRAPTERLIRNRQQRVGLERRRPPPPLAVTPTIWALTQQIDYPSRYFDDWIGGDREAYLHFESEPEIFPVTADGCEHLLHVFGYCNRDYFAAIDLRDTSDDPSVFYLAHSRPRAHRVSYRFSDYLRRLVAFTWR